MAFEWDEDKNLLNQEKHGISFEEAVLVFYTEEDTLEIYDVAHSESEERFITIGPIRAGIVVVVWTERHDDVVRIISARWASRTEVVRYRRETEDT